MPNKTIFCDIDGTLWKHTGDVFKMNETDYILTPNTVQAIKLWVKRDYKIILTTGRKESLREATEKSLKKMGIIYDQLVMGLGNGDRILINDRKIDSLDNRAFAINTVRDKGLEYYDFDSKYTVISDEQPKEVIKPWGKEELIEYNDNYVVKKLFMKKGECCSLQYHELKRETVYVLSGKLKLYIGLDIAKSAGSCEGTRDIAKSAGSCEGTRDIAKSAGSCEGTRDIANLSEKIMLAGDNITILPYTIHRMEGLEDSVYLESSTNQLWDVVRLKDKYKRIDIAPLKKGAGSREGTRDITSQKEVPALEEVSRDRKDILKNSKLCFGPMSKNIVDVIIDISNKNKIPITFIPSRRQIEKDGGYVNNWTTKDFCQYVYKNSNFIAIQRDHAGPLQGKKEDDGLESLEEDCKYFDSIHIDPFKKFYSIEEAVKETVRLILYCYNLNQNIYFEVATEEAIRKIEVKELEIFLRELKDNLEEQIFDRILFSVIQSGTSLKDGLNTGNYSSDKLREMIKITKKYNLLSKEHNGDFMETEIMKSRFDNRLDAINIAPELGIEETKIIMEKITSEEKINTIYKICYNSQKWKKWVSKDFNASLSRDKPEENKNKLIQICGHYIFTNLKFREILKEENITDDYIKQKLTIYLEKLFNSIYNYPIDF